MSWAVFLYLTNGALHITGILIMQRSRSALRLAAVSAAAGSKIFVGINEIAEIQEISD